MKKLVMLLLVLGLATVANAGLVFTLNGVPQPKEITLLPSEYVSLDLEIPQGSSVLGYDITYTVDPLAELITTGYGNVGPIAFPALFDLPSGITGTPLPQMVEMSGSQLFNPAVQGPATIMDHLVLHCLGIGDTLLEVTAGEGTIIDDEEIVPGTIMHTLIIHQAIPEPMTLTLLGLGSLFLARRKK